MEFHVWIYSGEDGEARNRGTLSLGEWKLSSVVTKTKVGNGWSCEGLVNQRNEISQKQWQITGGLLEDKSWRCKLVHHQNLLD